MFELYPSEDGPSARNNGTENGRVSNLHGNSSTTEDEEIDFDEIDDDLERFQEDEMVKSALHRGVDLKKYGQELGRQLKTVRRKPTYLLLLLYFYLLCCYPTTSVLQSCNCSLLFLFNLKILMYAFL